ncbi:MAG: deoxyuridine 5'-triphosphate nucleotidohydrolase [Candidatus Diapherotrites archaeon]|nr:deoxyuridine 5'-triphosphate nucleotidohydrolase [Candidatus Diapherotrites archaeon]
MLVKNEVLKLIQDGKMITGFIDLPIQLQPQGFDVTVSDVSRYKSRGQLDFSNKERSFPEFELLEWQEDGWWLNLEPGAYKIKTNEAFRMPLDITGFLQTRSSLLRMGATVNSGVMDAGFDGRCEFLLTVSNPNGLRLKHNARVAQMVFFKTSTKVDEGYSGIHKGLK